MFFVYLGHISHIYHIIYIYHITYIPDTEYQQEVLEMAMKKKRIQEVLARSVLDGGRKANCQNGLTVVSGA